jgi:hypothetical protein
MIAPVCKVVRIWVVTEEEAFKALAGVQVDRGISVWAGSPYLTEISLGATILVGVEIQVEAAILVEIMKHEVFADSDLKVGRTKDLLNVKNGDVPR